MIEIEIYNINSGEYERFLVDPPVVDYIEALEETNKTLVDAVESSTKLHMN